MFRKIALIGIIFFALTGFGQEPGPKQRHFVLRYAFTVKDVPAGKEFRVWIPLAHTDAFQDVQVLTKQGDAKLHKSAQDDFGNTALYAEAEPERTRDYRFVIEYDVVRTERAELAGDSLAPGAHPERASPPALSVYLQPNRLAPVTGLAAQYAANETKAGASPIEKARAIYDFFGRNWHLDHSSAGCCQGNANWAMENKRGDSLDLASVFIAMARSEQIPARCVLGFEFPADKHAAEIRKSTAWAEFYPAPMGWLAADIATAVQDSSRRDYAFGSLDTNRVQFSVGRDLKLNPPQEGPPLNFFINPYVEIDGKPYDKVSLDVSFHDVRTSAGTSLPR